MVDRNSITRIESSESNSPKRSKGRNKHERKQKKDDVKVSDIDETIIDETIIEDSPSREFTQVKKKRVNQKDTSTGLQCQYCGAVEVRDKDAVWHKAIHVVRSRRFTKQVIRDRRCRNCRRINRTYEMTWI